MKKISIRLIVILSVVLATQLFSNNTSKVFADTPTVIIDPGHGGSDPGAVGLLDAKLISEKTLNLQLSKKIKYYLGGYNVNVVLSRTSDNFISLQNRAIFANNLNANLFVSVHHDASSNKSANGISTHYSSYRANLNMGGDAYVKNYSNGQSYQYVKEVGSNLYYKDRNGVTKSISMNYATAFDDRTPTDVAIRSEKLAEMLANSMSSLGYKRMYTSNGAKDHNLYVTRQTNMTSVLIENGFVSNTSELRKISNPTTQNTTAKLIAQDIMNLLNSYDRKVEMDSLKVDKSSPQQQNTSININAAASGSSNLQYKFNIFDGTKWIVTQGYSKDNTFAWKPTKTGNYKVSVHVKDASSNKAYDDYRAFEYKVTEAVDISSVVTDKVSPQVQNGEILLTSKATGGTKLLYKFNIFDGKKWTVLSDYGTSSSLNWIPTSAGNYKFSVHVKDSNSIKAYDDYFVLDYAVTASPVIKNIAVDKKSPQYIGQTIKLTVDAIGGVNKQYKFNVYDGKEWKIVQNYTASPVLNWTPTVSGDYKFSVHVKDANSTKAYDHYQVLDYRINSNGVEVHSLSSNVSSPQLEGATISLTANATGGVDKLYKFHAYNGKEWIVLRDYDASNKIDWKPTAGDYKLVVHVKDSTSSNAYDSYTSKEFKIDSLPVVANSLDINLVSPQPEGTAMKVTAIATGGLDKLYKFHLFNGKEWTVLRDYGTSNQIDWKPSAGVYKLVVHVKNKTSKNAYDSYTSNNFIVNTTSVRMESITKAYESPQAAGTAVKLTANATGGTNKLYKFHVFNGKEWITLRDYNASNTLTWIPTKVGQYKISIHVKDQSSTKSYDAYQAFDYQVVAPVKMTNVTKTDINTENVRITANATGGIDKQYKFWVLNPQSNEWKVLQDYAANYVYDWKPGVTGEYKVSVHVKDKNSSNSYDDFEAFTYQK